MRRLKENRPAYFKIVRSPHLSSTRTNSTSTPATPKSHKRQQSMNFLRFGTPADTIVHVPQSVARFNNNARKDLTKSHFSFENLLHSHQPKRKAIPVLENEEEFLNSIKSVTLPIKSFSQVARSRLAFCISPKELTDSERIRIDIMRRIRSEAAIETHLSLGKDAERSRNVFFKSVEAIKEFAGGSIENAKKQSIFTAFSHSHAQMYLDAVKNSNYSTVEQFLSLDKKLVLVKDSIGQTGLHWAAKRNDLAMVRLLKSAGADINATDMTLRTPLYVAARKDWPDMVTLLLELGGDKSLASLNGTTPADVAKEGSVSWMVLNKRGASNVGFSSSLESTKRKSISLTVKENKEKSVLI